MDGEQMALGIGKPSWENLNHCLMQVFRFGCGSPATLSSTNGRVLPRCSKRKSRLWGAGTLLPSWAPTISRKNVNGRYFSPCTDPVAACLMRLRPGRRWLLLLLLEGEAKAPRGQNLLPLGCLHHISKPSLLGSPYSPSLAPYSSEAPSEMMHWNQEQTPLIDSRKPGKTPPVLLRFRSSTGLVVFTICMAMFTVSLRPRSGCDSLVLPGAGWVSLLGRTLRDYFFDPLIPITSGLNLSGRPYPPLLLSREVRHQWRQASVKTALRASKWRLFDQLAVQFWTSTFLALYGAANFLGGREFSSDELS